MNSKFCMGVYRHYKGGLYGLVEFTRDSEDWDGKGRLTYINAKGEKISRPAEMWDELVGECPDVQRFELLWRCYDQNQLLFNLGLWVAIDATKEAGQLELSKALIGKLQ